MSDTQRDKQLNIETTGNQYGFPQMAHYHRYEPTPYEGLDILGDIYPLDNRSFVDIGCGKGRVPIYMYDRFRIPAVGIDMKEQYIEEAKQNKVAYLRKHPAKKHTVEFVYNYAQAYDILPTQDVFFFFNPFSVQIFMKFMANLFDSYAQHPRVMTIILYYPSHDYIEYMAQTPFTFVKEIRIQTLYKHNEHERFLIYEM